ncbi:MAG: PH domain-containing protein [Desulfovibrionales bacterium]|nr:PH domain-containing protein [Desulfovibrionales bacterium]
MAEIKLDCPHCGQHLEGDEELCGQTIKCPSCNGEIIIPAKAAPPPAAKVARITTSAPPMAAAPSSDEEHQVFELKPTAKAFLGEIIFGILLIPVFLIGLILLLNVWYKVVSLKYRLTTQRLFVQKGLIAKHLEELELFRVKDVTVKQGILQRLLGFGTIIVLSTDDSNPQVLLIGINKPVDVKETIRNSFRAARKREGVKMAEFIPS